MKNKMIKGILVSLLSASAISTNLPVVNAYASPSKDKSKDNKKISASIKSTNNKSNSEKVSIIEDNIEKLDNQIEKSMIKSDNLKKEISKTEKEIDTLNLKIKNTEEDLSQQRNLMDGRMRGIYKKEFCNNQLYTYLGVLFSGKGLSDILSEWNSLNKMNELDKSLLAEINEKEDSLNKDKKKCLEKQEKLKNDKKEIESTLKEQKKLKDDQNKLLKKTKKDIEIEKKRREEAIKKAKELEKKLLEQRRKILEERKKQEALAKLNQIQNQINTIQQNNQNSLVQNQDTDANQIQTISPDTDKVTQVIQESFKYLGVPYLWGGTTPQGFDCSGYMQYIFAKVGVNLPRVSEEQQTVGQPVASNDLQPGDLIFWGYPAHHVGMYIGNGQYIQAPHTGDYIKISQLGSYTNAKRVL